MGSKEISPCDKPSNVLGKLPKAPATMRKSAQRKTRALVDKLITEKDIEDIIKKQVYMAKNGSQKAAEWVLNYKLGNWQAEDAEGAKQPQIVVNYLSAPEKQPLTIVDMKQ